MESDFSFLASVETFCQFSFLFCRNNGQGKVVINSESKPSYIFLLHEKRILILKAWFSFSLLNYLKKACLPRCHPLGLLCHLKQPSHPFPQKASSLTPCDVWKISTNMKLSYEYFISSRWLANITSTFAYSIFFFLLPLQIYLLIHQLNLCFVWATGIGQALARFCDYMENKTQIPPGEWGKHPTKKCEYNYRAVQKGGWSFFKVMLYCWIEVICSRIICLIILQSLETKQNTASASGWGSGMDCSSWRCSWAFPDSRFGWLGEWPFPLAHWESS